MNLFYNKFEVLVILNKNIKSKIFGSGVCMWLFNSLW